MPSQPSRAYENRARATARVSALAAIAAVLIALSPAQSVVAQATGKLGIIGDSIASGTHTTDVCDKRDIVECVQDIGGTQSRDWSYAGGSQSWSLATKLGFAPDRVVDASDDGEEWKDAYDQATQIMATPGVESVFIGLGANDVCQRRGHDYTGDLAVIATHIDATLTYLTDRLPAGGAIYWSGMPDVVKLYELMRQRDHNLLFESCQATWDIDSNKVKDGAASDACDHYFDGSLCGFADYSEEAKDLLVQLFLDTLLAAADVDEGPCGKVLDSRSTEQDRLEAAAFTSELNQLMAEKAAAYTGRNGVAVYFNDRVYHASAQMQPYHLSRLDCYHPSRTGQMFLADQLWGGFDLGQEKQSDVFLDEFDSQDYCSQELTEWGSCWEELGENNGPTSGDIRIGEERLRIKDDNKGLARAVPLDRADQAWISFNWRRKDLDRAGDYVTFDVSSDAGRTWTELDRFKGDGSDYGLHRGRYYDIGTFAGPDTRIRFKSSRGLGNNDIVYIDNVTILSWDESQPAAVPPIVGEVAATDSWQPLAVPAGDAPPVVILAEPVDLTATPAVAELRDVGADMFELRLRAWDGAPSTPAARLVSYLVLHPGTYVLPDGSRWEVGRFVTDRNGGWQRQTFRKSFVDPPRLLVTPQTSSGSAPALARVRNVSESGFELALEEHGPGVPADVAETVGYLAVHSPQGSGEMRIASAPEPYDVGRIGLADPWAPEQSVLEALAADAALLVRPWESLDLAAVGPYVLAQQVSGLDAWSDRGAPLGDEWSLETVDDGPRGPAVLRLTDNDDVSEYLFSDRVPVSQDGTYRVSLWIRQPEGDRSNYLLVAFYDGQGRRIGADTGHSGWPSGAVGWRAISAYAYWGPVVANVFPSAWHHYELVIGPGGTANMPEDAATMAVGGLFSRRGVRGGTATSIELQDYRVEVVTIP